MKDWASDKAQVHYYFIIMGTVRCLMLLESLAVYRTDVTVDKEDCINHVSKRMGTALRNLVSESKAQKDSISGKGKLTKDKIDKIQNYYC